MYIESNKKDESVQRIQGEINRRFFEILNDLILDNKVKSVAEFAKQCGLNRTRYWELSREFGVKPDPGFVSRYREIEILALIYLNMRYGVSLDYVLRGIGEKFIAAA